MTAVAKSRKIVFLAVLTFLLALVLPVGGVAEESPALERPPARGVVDLSGLETFMASEAGAPFQLRVEPSPSVQADSGSTVMDKALGLVGLPGMSGASDDESAYEKAWRMRGGPNGTTRLSYGERYRRNPDGSYGAQSSSKWDSANIGDRWLEQALSAGSGYFSSWAEGWLAGYGQARISVRVNDEGDVSGSGDFLYPFYDSEHSTFFIQLGLRTMANDRVIGNFGLGQRFFPAENFALGYNAFIDQDFSRNHSRGGVGLEAWYDWVRLSANYYTPLSGWKDSKDYDSRLVEERPAEGFDARLTGYLPFYRNLAVTSAFEQWKGEHVGSFGSDDVLQKDPKIWSYGLEWTPVPAFSTSVNQRHSGGQKETQFGLTFNYHFGMDWEDQLSPAMVAEMRTVGGSRHDFVNRRNEIILEYRAKNVAGSATGLLKTGLNILICDDGGANCQPFASGGFTSADFIDESSGYFSLVNLKVADIPGGCNSLTCADDLSGASITWTIINVGDPAAGFYWNHASGATNGLSWGVTPLQLSATTQSSDASISTIPNAPSGNPEMVNLTDIVGSRSITIQVTVDGVPETATFAFGNGPLSVFGGLQGNRQWANAYPIDAASSFPSATACGGSVSKDNFPLTGSPGNADWEGPFWDYVFNPPWDYYYARESRLPKASELRAVSGYDGTYNPVGKGASLAAGWPVASYWTGEVTAHPGDAGHGARLVNLGNGYADNAVDLVFSYPVVCRP